MTDPSTADATERPDAEAPRRASFDRGSFDDADGVSYRCDRCGRPFEREEWLSLHLGHAHPGELDDAEIEEFRDAHASEESRLDRFRLLALGALVCIYFGLLLVYALLAL